ncbi:MAG: exodeoxyribonuclease VII large subunit [Phycisphaerales bacterium]
MGHESDVTVAELVADRRASTPTAAVMLLLPDREGMQQQSDHLHDRLRFLMQRRVHDARVLVERLARHPGLKSPTAGIAARRADLDRAWARLGRAAAARLSSEAARLSDCRARLERVRPAARHAVAGERLAALEARLRSAVRRAATDRRRHLRVDLGRCGVAGRLARGLLHRQRRLLHARAHDAVGQARRDRASGRRIGRAPHQATVGVEGE